MALTFLASGAAPVFAADTICSFRARGLSLNFGLIDPSVGLNISRPITIVVTNANQAGDCVGGNMTISIVGSSSRQLVSGVNIIDYTVSGFPITLPRPGNAPPGNPAPGYINWFAPGQLQGTILWPAFANAPAGTYVDSITLQVNP